MDFNSWDVAFSEVWATLRRYELPETERFFYFDVGYPPKQAAEICERNDPAHFW